MFETDLARAMIGEEGKAANDLSAEIYWCLVEVSHMRGQRIAVKELQIVIPGRPRLNTSQTMNRRLQPPRVRL